MNRFVRLVLFPLVIVLVLAAAVVGIVAVSDGADEPPALGAGSGEAGAKLTVLTKQPDTALAPKEPISVGKQPYVSVCQLLPRARLEEILGSLSTDTSVRESFLDHSVPSERDDAGSVSTGCRISGRWRFSLELEQETEPLKEVEDVMDLLPYEQSDVSRMMRIYREVDLDEEPAARALLAKMEESWAIYEVQGDGSTLDDVTSMVLPELDEYSENSRQFTIVEGSRAVEISYEAKSVPDDAQLLDKMAQVIAVIRTNLDDPDLGQAPVPELTEGAQVGSTKVLEACAVFNRDVFVAGTGLRPNGTVTRRPLGKGYSKVSKDAYRSNAVNSCDRSYDAYDLPDGYKKSKLEAKYGDEGNASMEVEISYAPDPATAKTMAASFKRDGAKALRTGADEAYLWRRDDYSGVTFRTGAYVVRVNSAIETYSREGGYKDITISFTQYVRAINALVKNIKAQST